MTPISSLKFSNIENYHFFRVSVDQEKKWKKYVTRVNTVNTLFARGFQIGRPRGWSQNTLQGLRSLMSCVVSTVHAKDEYFPVFHSVLRY